MPARLAGRRSPGCCRPRSVRRTRSTCPGDRTACCRGPALLPLLRPRPFRRLRSGQLTDATPPIAVRTARSDQRGSARRLGMLLAELTDAQYEQASSTRPPRTPKFLPLARSCFIAALAAAALLAVPGRARAAAQAAAAASRRARAGRPRAGLHPADRLAGAPRQARTAAGHRARRLPLPLPGPEPQRQRRRAAPLPRRAESAPPGRAGAGQRQGQGDQGGNRAGDGASAPAPRSWSSPWPPKTPASPRAATAGGCWRAAAASCGGAAPRRCPPKAASPSGCGRCARSAAPAARAGLDTNGSREPQGRRPHLRRRPQRIHRRLPPGAARKGRRRHLLRDRPGDAGARSDDAPDPRRRQRDRRPHDEPRRIPGLLADRRRRHADRGLHALQALPLPAARRRRRLQRHRHRRQPRAADDQLGRRPDGLVDSRHQRHLRARSSARPSPARSSSCTTAAATAARPWRRCRRSSTPCARRGYEFETVSQLLGYQLIYKPYD